MILCKVPQPEVPFTVDGCVMVMKSDDMNLPHRRGKCLAHAHNTLKNWPNGLCAETLARDKHHSPQRCFCSVSTFIYFKRDGVKLRRIVLPDTLYKGNVLT